VDDPPTSKEIYMKKSVSVTIGQDELKAMLMKGIEAGKVVVKVPRKEGEFASASLEIDSKAFQVAMANALEVDIDELAALEVSVKRDGAIVITF
jgi:hypothetical protein